MGLVEHVQLGHDVVNSLFSVKFSERRENHFILCDNVLTLKKHSDTVEYV